MNYYEVLVGDIKYHGDSALTYSSDKAIPIGSIAKVELRSREVLGIIIKTVSKPSFLVKPISSYSNDWPPLPTQSLELLAWLKDYYPAPLGTIVRQFLPGSTSSPKLLPDPSTTNAPSKPLPPLTTEQLAALKSISGSGLFILHGATGTGKTRLYIELTKKCISNNMSAIILTPEIGLTAQLVDDFKNNFPVEPIVFHSQLTVADRRNIWYYILASTHPLVIIGPRSALFMPIKNVGLIVIDESHDTAYKNESSPHYVTSRVAATLAHLHKATFIMGSATPSVEDYYIAEQKNRPIIRLTTPASTAVSTEVDFQIIDLRDRSNFSSSQIISKPLLKAITEALDKKQQIMLFLNRRGTAKVVLCSNCGWQPLCPRCDISLVYHGDLHLLRCHTCGYRQAPPSVCPVCASPDIIFKSAGTKAVVDEVERLFPAAQTQRFDGDSIGVERLEQNMNSLKSGKIDIIIGTQTIAKGLDLPKLSVVGIINADTSLYIPDYTASERTYQLLSQVIGRVGRGHSAGQVVVQTYLPDGLSLKSAVVKDWEAFYTNELNERRTYHFPPFTYLLKLSCKRASSNSAEATAKRLAEQLSVEYPRVTIDGPAPSFRAVVAGKHSWQLTIKSTERTTLTRIIAGLPANWDYDIDPANLL
ncbi:MAG: primosomal protein N' [Candidatus Saccharimonadales bacterium]